MNVRTLYHTARGLQDLAATERESAASPSIRRRLWLWRRGFLSRSDAVYDLDESTYRDYLNDYRRFVRTKQINGTWSVALSNKLLFHRVMQPFDDHRMGVYGMIRNGSFHSVDGSDSRREVTDGGAVVPTESEGEGETDSRGAAERRNAGDTERQDSNRPDLHSSAEPRNAAQRVVERLERDDRLVLKWVRGGGGNNVLLCERTDDGYRVNGDRYAEAEFRSLVSDLEEYLVCEYVEQGSFADGLYAETPNTIRIITMYDEERNEPFIAAAIQRIGTAASAPLDNFTQGGLSAEIDLETGELGPGVQPPGDGDLEWHAVHPETKTPVEGAHIPGWSEIRERVLEMADACSFVPYVGWDVIVTGDDGEFSVIEANSYPGLKSIQVHGPLLADNRVRRFYERHGVR
ncbi:sugar-transfer associated ATP-grasp domain-containing protein [Natronorubrum sp. DTA28]|uniref:sugar-transfer associated ATP-grasp domain-containing protein n=1 Tax=Natronorubrum sp. DTA28 TaxID=3447019 RepID=UPI003F843F44